MTAAASPSTAPRERDGERRRRTLLVVTEPAQEPGFRLAGVTTRAAESPEEASAMVVEALADAGGPSVVAVHEPYLEQFDAAFGRRLGGLTDPLVIALPGGARDEAAESRQSRLARMLWQAVGYEITFDEGGTK